jgi:prevent-host-death family protein
MKDLRTEMGCLQDMKTTVTSAEAKAHFARLLRPVEAGETIAISKRDETVAFLIPRARLEALVETMEILGNAKAMRAIRQHEAGKLSFHPVSALGEPKDRSVRLR